MLEALLEFLNTTGFANLTWGNLIMLVIGCLLIYLGIAKKYEPLLLIPIGFGIILANLPLSGLMEEGGLLYYLYYGVQYEILPCLIFLGVGALTDFGPLIANPKTFLMGAAAQLGIFATLFVCLAIGFDINEAGGVGMIGTADGPIAIYAAAKLAPDLIGPIAVAAYSYMALVPIIQPPIMRLLTTKKERAIVMEELRPVSRLERTLFPIVLVVAICWFLPKAAPLLGMLLLGNLLRESGVTDRLARSASTEIIDVSTIFLGVCVGATMSAAATINAKTIEILALGLFAFAVGTIGGLLMGKLLCKLTRGQINPLIGSAGVSAIPMAARVSQKEGQRENPNNYLLFHAMGPNVAGVIGSACVAGILLSFLM